MCWEACIVVGSSGIDHVKDSLDPVKVDSATLVIRRTVPRTKSVRAYRRAAALAMGPPRGHGVGIFRFPFRFIHVHLCSYMFTVSGSASARISCAPRNARTENTSPRHRGGPDLDGVDREDSVPRERCSAVRPGPTRRA
jgi:hypothetical protein